MGNLGRLTGLMICQHTLELDGWHFYFVPALLLSIFTLLFLTSSSGFLFHSCSQAQVFGKTIMHELHIYCKTRWSLLRLKIHLSTTSNNNNWDRLTLFCVHLSIFLYSLISECLFLILFFLFPCASSEDNDCTQVSHLL